MPIWLSALGFPGAPPFPNVAIPGTIVSLLGHVVHAVPVALAYALATGEYWSLASTGRWQVTDEPGRPCIDTQSMPTPVDV